MKITDAPALITTPFAQNGTRNDIPAAGDGLDTGRASFATGFPDETMKPITAGGVPPFGADFNGILYALTNAARFYGAGGHYKFNADFASKIGGYPMGATVQATDNMGHWLNVVEANSTDPESALSTGWLPLADHNGTATVILTASTALTPLQAAKANLRFTGTPTGNVTVTFPAWTKRYSIINDCTGDGSVICTTGNGESISIKNGAKYEIGCDGKNLTVSTVNASQVFADPNKNVSSLDAPTVQQVINALGSAASHAAKDFEAAGTSELLKESLRSGAYCPVYDNGSASYTDLPQGNNILATSGTVRSAVSKVDDSISSIGKSGLFYDALEIPDWIKQQKFDENGSLILTSSNGTSIRLTSLGYIDIYNNSGEKVWTINPRGVLEMGVVPIERVSGIGTAARTSLYDVPEASYTDLPQGGDKSISPGTVRSVVSKLKDSLGSSAFTEIYDNGSASYTDLPQGGGKSISPGTVRAAIFNSLFSGREFGDVGTYCFAKNMSITSAISPGQIVDGSNLAPSSSDQAHGGRLSGQWRCMGGSRGNDQPNGFFMTTLYMRIS